MPKPVKPRPATSWSYVLECDRSLPPMEQTRFTLKPMTGTERDAFYDSYQQYHVDHGKAAITQSTQSLARRLCLTHIANVENFPPGAPQSWPNDPDARTKYLEQFDDAHVREIGLEIWRASALTEEEKQRAGESLPPSATPPSPGTTAASTSTTAENANATPS